jgi:hypothetical protein
MKNMQAPPGVVLKREIHHNSKRYLVEIEDITTKENGVLKMYTQAEVIRYGISKVRKKFDIFQKLNNLGVEGVLKATEVYTTFNDTVSIVFKLDKDKENQHFLPLSEQIPLDFSSFIDTVLIILETLWGVHKLGFSHNEV